MNWTKISSSLPSVQVWSIMFSINKRRLITSRNMTIYSGREGLKTRFRGVKRDVGGTLAILSQMNGKFREDDAEKRKQRKTLSP